jgi:hypothetical protein
MQKTTAKVYGVLIALLAVVGLFTSGHAFDLMNVDPMLDILRVVLAAVLLYAGFGAAKQDFVRGSLMVVGFLYVGMGVLGLFNSELWGLLPSGLTGFDIAFHLVTGVAALGVAVAKERPHVAHPANS